ncbi:MAG: class I SAM-dependent methyltransferase [Chloroflexi bacterium]|nr:class I SAM-dependent methyltransferase [Chloroflexota bacterium]
MPFDHFDLIAGLYNRVAQFSAPASFLDLLALPSSGLLLDAGGGTGRVAEALHSMVREVVVVDLSRGMLRHAADKGLATACAPAEHLPFASNAFDRIIMVDALHHVYDQHQTVAELWRVLSHDGRIVIIEPDIHKFAVKLIAFGEKLLFMRSHFLPAEKIAGLFANQITHVRVFFDESNILVCAEKAREV